MHGSCHLKSQSFSLLSLHNNSTQTSWSNFSFWILSPCFHDDIEIPGFITFLLIWIICLFIFLWAFHQTLTFHGFKSVFSKDSSLAASSHSWLSFSPKIASACLPFLQHLPYSENHFPDFLTTLLLQFSPRFPTLLNAIAIHSFMQALFGGVSETMCVRIELNNYNKGNSKFWVYNITKIFHLFFWEFWHWLFWELLTHTYPFL